MSTMTFLIALIAFSAVAFVAIVVSEYRNLPAAQEDEYLEFWPQNPWAGKYRGSHRR